MNKFKTLLATMFLATCSLNANVAFAEEVIIEKINAQISENIAAMEQKLNEKLEKEIEITMEKTILKEKQEVKSEVLVATINKTAE